MGMAPAEAVITGIDMLEATTTGLGNISGYVVGGSRLFYCSIPPVFLDLTIYSPRIPMCSPNPSTNSCIILLFSHHI